MISGRKRFLADENISRIFRIGAFEPRSLVNGPGVRAVLWVQGCNKRCPGCFNPDFQKSDGGRLVETEEVIQWIKAAQGIEGVTFSGGEPFDQAGALAIVAEKVRRSSLSATQQSMGSSIVVFTGYTWEELQQREDRGAKALLGATDLLIAGPYDQNLPSSHPFLGSANQEMIFLTDRYRGYNFGKGKRSEFHISPDGSVRVTGLMGAVTILTEEDEAWQSLQE